MPRKQPFVNRQFVTDVEYLERNSPDLVVDLGVLAHILAKRSWSGNYQGWTNVPVEWFGNSSHMGHRRIKASLDRLAGWGIITAMSTNGRKGPQALNYRYDLRPEYVQLAPEPEVAEYEVEEAEHPTPPPEPVVRVRHARPALKSDESGAYGEIYVFDPKKWRMKAVRVAPSEYANSPVCQTCGRVYHNTEGAGGNEGECAGCYITNVLTKALEEGKETQYITSPYERRAFNREEMSRLVENMYS